MLESWRGRAFTPVELDAFDVSKLVGVNCLLNVVHQNGTGVNSSKTYANVQSVNPLMGGMAKSTAVNPLLVFSMDDFPGPIVIPESVPDWIRKLIESSDEYKARLNPSRPAAINNPTGEAFPNDAGADSDTPF